MHSPLNGAVAGKYRLVGGEGIWTFICADIAVFSLMFMTFSSYWSGQNQLFLSSQAHLSAGIGVANTIILLTSSWFVAKAVQAARRRDFALARPLLAGAIACGAGFVSVKVFEYGEKASAGFTLTTNDFFMFYYVMTGLHLLHCVIGVLVLVYLMTRLRPICSGDEDVSVLEAGASYWHMVDLIWIFLFPILYLVH